MSVNTVKQDGSLQRIAGGTVYADAPLGTVFASLTTKIPKGFILCDDTVYNKADYPELWELLPDIVKDTTNETFTIDLRESTLKGVGLTSKSSNHYDSDGIALGEFIDDRIKSHGHESQWYNSGNGEAYSYNARATILSAGSGGDASWPPYKAIRVAAGTSISTVDKNYVNYSLGIVGTGSATNEVKSTGVNFIMKAKQVALPTDFEDAVDEKIADNIVDSITNSSMKAVTSNAVYDAFKDISNHFLIVTYTWPATTINANSVHTYYFNNATTDKTVPSNAIRIGIYAYSPDGSTKFLTRYIGYESVQVVNLSASDNSCTLHVIITYYVP